MKFLLSLLITFVLSVNFFSGYALAFNADSAQKVVLNTEELVQKINFHVKQSMPNNLQVLERTVNINSGTLNLVGVKQVADVLRKEFETLGMETQWLDGAKFNRAGHLVASYGNQGPKILMIGHLDTVFSQTDSFQKFTRIDERYIAGPGITDMKGGNVIIISALRTLKQLGILDDVQIQVVLTGDEESSGRPLALSKQAIIDAAKWADVALGFEDGDGDVKTAVVARRGSVSWNLSVKGKPAHSSQIFQDNVGFGANFELVRILNSFREELSSIENLTFNPGLMIGGTRLSLDDKQDSAEVFGKNNVIAQTAQVTGGIRAISPEQLVSAKMTMQKISQQNLAHTSATLVFDEGYPPMAPTDGNYRLLKMYNEASQMLGYGEVVAVDPRKAGAADISFAADHVDMALDGLGLMGTGGHTKDEIADMTSFEQNINKATLLIYRLSQLKQYQ